MRRACGRQHDTKGSRELYPWKVGRRPPIWLPGAPDGASRCRRGPGWRRTRQVRPCYHSRSRAAGATILSCAARHACQGPPGPPGSRPFTGTSNRSWMSLSLAAVSPASPPPGSCGPRVIACVWSNVTRPSRKAPRMATPAPCCPPLSTSGSAPPSCRTGARRAAASSRRTGFNAVARQFVRRIAGLHDPAAFARQYTRLHPLIDLSRNALADIEARHPLEFEQRSGVLNLVRSQPEWEQIQPALELLRLMEIPHRVLSAAQCAAHEHSVPTDPGIRRRRAVRHRAHRELPAVREAPQADARRTGRRPVPVRPRGRGDPRRRPARRRRTGSTQRRNAFARGRCDFRRRRRGDGGGRQLTAARPAGPAPADASAAPAHADRASRPRGMCAAPHGGRRSDARHDYADPPAAAHRRRRGVATSGANGKNRSPRR